MSISSACFPRLNYPGHVADRAIPLVEIFGYVGRAIGSHQTPYWTVGPFIVQALGILLAPALFAASIYMTLGRLIRLVNGEVHSPVSRVWLTKIFVAGDILSFFTQSGGEQIYFIVLKCHIFGINTSLPLAGGALIAGKKPNQVKTGQNIIVGGLIIQIIFFGIFMLTATIFDIRIRKAPTLRSADPAIPWKKHMRVLYIASAFIMIRSVFRVIEYVQGNDGYILRHEEFLYIFDGCLMLAVLVLFNIIHPSEITALYGRSVSATNRDVALQLKSGS